MNKNKDDVADLINRLRSWAQNEERIDSYYTDHGIDCNEAADLLEDLFSQDWC